MLKSADRDLSLAHDWDFAAQPSIKAQATAGALARRAPDGSADQRSTRTNRANARARGIIPRRSKQRIPLHPVDRAVVSRRFEHEKVFGFRRNRRTSRPVPVDLRRSAARVPSRLSLQQKSSWSERPSEGRWCRGGHWRSVSGGHRGCFYCRSSLDWRCED